MRDFVVSSSPLLHIHYSLQFNLTFCDVPFLTLYIFPPFFIIIFHICLFQKRLFLPNFFPSFMALWLLTFNFLPLCVFRLFISSFFLLSFFYLIIYSIPCHFFRCLFSFLFFLILPSNNLPLLHFCLNYFVLSLSRLS